MSAPTGLPTAEQEGQRDPQKLANIQIRRAAKVRLICGYLLRSLLPFLTCIYETLLDLEIYNWAAKVPGPTTNMDYPPTPSPFSPRTVVHCGSLSIKWP